MAPPIPQPDAPSTLDRLWLFVQRGVEALCIGLFGLMFLVFLFKIIRRYAFGDAAAWGDELVVVLFVWIVFLANGFLVSDRQQICFDLLDRHMAPPFRRMMAMCRILLLGGIFLWSLPGALDYIQFLWRERTPVLLLRLDLVYSCFGLFLVVVIARMAWRLVDLVRPGWTNRL